MVEQHRQLIAGLGLPVQGEDKLQDMLQAWMRDKKYRHGIRFVLLNQLGQPDSGVTADQAMLAGVLSDLAGGRREEPSRSEQDLIRTKWAVSHI